MNKINGNFFKNLIIEIIQFLQSNRKIKFCRFKVFLEVKLFYLNIRRFLTWKDLRCLTRESLNVNRYEFL
jgi:hypothetical protein